MTLGERKTTQGLAGGRKLSLLLKIVYTLFVCVLVPAYWHHYGFADSFLWVSSLALLITLSAVWLESRLLASMQLVSVVPPGVYLAAQMVFTSHLLLLRYLGFRLVQRHPLRLRRDEGIRFVDPNEPGITFVEGEKNERSAAS